MPTALEKRLSCRDHTQGAGLEDFGWLINYSPSASRWIDAYTAVGWEWDYQVLADGSTRRDSFFVTETGIKFRVNIHHTPFKFLAKLGTSFWGLRVGIQTVGVWDFDRIGYVFEFGAGSW